jgi:hypothetical protein
MNYAGVNFNTAHYKSKTEAEFIAHESHHGLTEKQLKEAYSLMPHDLPTEIKEAAAKVEKLKTRFKNDSERPSK